MSCTPPFVLLKRSSTTQVHTELTACLVGSTNCHSTSFWMKPFNGSQLVNFLALRSRDWSGEKASILREKRDIQMSSISWPRIQVFEVLSMQPTKLAVSQPLTGSSDCFCLHAGLQLWVFHCLPVPHVVGRQHSYPLHSRGSRICCFDQREDHVLPLCSQGKPGCLPGRFK